MGVDNIATYAANYNGTKHFLIVLIVLSWGTLNTGEHLSLAKNLK